MFLKFLLAVLVFGWGYSAQAEEDPQYSLKDSIIFVGEFVKTTIVADRTPVGLGNCTGEGEDETCVVIVTADGACGWETVEYDVLQNLKGAESLQNVTLQTYLNAWCKSSVEVLLDESFVFALKRHLNFTPDVNEEFFIRTFQVMRIDDLKRVVFIDAPHLMNLCGAVLKLSCWDSLKTIEPWELSGHDPSEQWWRKFYAEYLEKGIMVLGEDNKVYITQVLDVDDLISRLGNKVKK